MKPNKAKLGRHLHRIRKARLHWIEFWFLILGIGMMGSQALDVYLESEHRYATELTMLRAGRWPGGPTKDEFTFSEDILKKRLTRSY